MPNEVGSVDVGGHEVSHPVNFNEVVARSQATTLDGMGKMYGLATDLQRGMFTKKMDEVDPVQAASIAAMIKQP